MKNRLIGFDLARVLAIFYIVGVYHNFGYVGCFHKNHCTLSLVYTTLGVFTFLSSFLLSSKYTFNGKNETLRFYRKRILRVWPLFVISSLLLFAIHFNPFGPTIKGIIGLSPFWKPAPKTMWYVAMLLSLYLITPFVRRGRLTAQIMKACFVLAVVGLIQLVFKSVVNKTFNYYTVYLVGVVLGGNFYQPILCFLKSKKTLSLSMIWAVLFVLVYVTKNDWLKSITGVLGIVAMLNVSLLISEKYSSKQLFIKVTSVLAYSSFCAYLFHREVMWLLLHLYRPIEGHFVFLEILLIGVPLTFFCAYYIQKIYDGLIAKYNGLLVKE